MGSIRQFSFFLPIRMHPWPSSEPKRPWAQPSTELAQSKYQMDTFFTTTPVVVVDTPTNQEDGGGTGNTYCVVSQSENIPANQEDGGGTGNTYCVIA
ncbi:hypothetical protein BDN70DRAFT_928471 [Pholiota conissans]|uniref:Uncharacterized protein n=1 Tax=Pholiota conissans TaxID=109636 RepID=A0A9P5ZC25_9AGAR|nr:hypothetical protein BDN70DRAFT_928471 [Pholiota conissans]